MTVLVHPKKKKPREENKKGCQSEKDCCYMSGCHHPSGREDCFKHIQASAATLQNRTPSTLRQYHLTAATNIMNILVVLLFSSDNL